MEAQQSEWITEYEAPYPYLEQQVGDARAIYLNSAIAYSFFQDIDRLYPILENDAGNYLLIFHTKCPLNYHGRSYKIYQQKRSGTIRHFLPIPKHLRATLVKGKKRVMYNLKLLYDEKGNKIILIDIYGGN